MMNPAKFNKAVCDQLEELHRDGLLTQKIFASLKAQYVTDRWDWVSLGRWFLIFGAISVTIGASIFIKDIFDFTLSKLAVSLALVMTGLFIGGWHLRQKSYSWTGKSVELIAGMVLIGLTFTLGIIYSSGSGNWPALLLIDLIVLIGLTYALNNVLLLILSAVIFFIWFGGVTGYASGWQAYWFGMNYPLRFLMASVAIIAIALLHRNSEKTILKNYQGFFKVWLSAGSFFAEMSLWLMSLFGNFNSIFSYHKTYAAELLLFNLLWAGFNIALLYAGTRYSLRMLRGYAITFLLIQAYTLFFRYIISNMEAISALFLTGGITLMLVIVIEKKRRAMN